MRKEVVCGAPEPFPNGWIDATQNLPLGMSKVGRAIVYRCNTNLKQIGASNAICEISGRWSNNPPQCLCKLICNSIRHLHSIVQNLVSDGSFYFKSALHCPHGGSRDHWERFCRINNISRRQRDPRMYPILPTGSPSVDVHLQQRDVERHSSMRSRWTFRKNWNKFRIFDRVKFYDTFLRRNFDFFNRAKRKL